MACGTAPINGQPRATDPRPRAPFPFLALSPLLQMPPATAKPLDGLEPTVTMHTAIIGFRATPQTLKKLFDVGWSGQGYGRYSEESEPRIESYVHDYRSSCPDYQIDSDHERGVGA